MKKGYEGEVLFDELTEKLQCECLILNDLLLEVNNTYFQIDSLIIMQRKFHLYEVKNYEGDFYYESDKLYKKPKMEVINPLHQLSRCESLLRQLLHSHGFNPQIVASVVFINPQFTLYQAPIDKPIIFPTQLIQHMENVNEITSKLTEKHKKVADQLLSLNITDSPHKKIPPYYYDKLQKGVTCPQCHSFAITVAKRICICNDCGSKESVTNAVLRTVNEFQILFPNEKITTNIIHDWCQVVQSIQRIRKILVSNFKIVGAHQWAYYI
ncbi:nuclease-related domain-containing protein [Virgibacillus necropolis]|uniref:nuclease-related domain-containing protein n=1 Tax=Virgibacillus necropolis TaxID=163877 RepID=UPI0029C78276|nr:nuclease-related domain-containing protein [Virgibacillus necropolis]